MKSSYVPWYFSEVVSIFSCFVLKCLGEVNVEIFLLCNVVLKDDPFYKLM